MDLLSLAEKRTTLKKHSVTHGGEYVGPCPACGGTDRFHVWPNKHDSKRSERIGVYWCRSCGKSGDVIRWFVDFEAMSYAAAFRALGEEMPSDYSSRYAAPRIGKAARTEPPAPQPDPEVEQAGKWMDKAEALVEFAEKELVGNAKILAWLKKRGIGKKAAAANRLGWLSEDRYRPRAVWGLPPERKDDGSEKKLWIPAGLVIPLIAEDGAVRRIRIRRFSDRPPKYYVLPGSAMTTMTFGLPARAAVVVESELDAIMIADQAQGLAAAVGMGSAKLRPGRRLAEALSACATILVSLGYGDVDLAGAKGCTWWLQAYRQAKRWPVPVGNDPGEALEAGVDIRGWIAAGLPKGLVIGAAPIGLVTGAADACVLDEREDQAASGGGAGGAVIEGTAAVTEGGSAHAAGERLPAGTAESMGPAGTISGLDELAGLLRRHPVEVRVAPDGSRILIRENQGWKRRNWDTAKRISELVFMDCEVLDYLLHHGAEIINGKNILEVEIG